MRGRRVLSRAISMIAVAAAAQAVLAVPAAGVATNPPSSSAPCASGAIAGEASGESLVSLHGWIEPCSATLPGAMFDVVYYYPDVAVLAESYRYAALPARTPVSMEKDLDGPDGSRPGSGDLHAICLALYLRNPFPVACVRIQRTGPDQVEVSPIDLHPLAGTDPVLAVTQWYGERSIEEDPHCGTCL